MAQGPFINRAPDYSDLDLDFFAHPTTKDVMIKTGEDAVKRSIRNLLFTNFYDRPFRHNIGSNVTRMLFDNVTPMTAMFLREAIIETINNFEPRVRVTEVSVNFDIDNNGFNVTLQYVILNRELPVVTSLFLERIR
jgi:phage baseplate assembly protein W